MHPQRWILIAALAIAGGYVWLSGGFVGVVAAMRPASAPAAAIPSDSAMVCRVDSMPDPAINSRSRGMAARAARTTCRRSSTLR